MIGLKPGYKQLASPKGFKQFIDIGISEEERQAIADTYDYDFHARKIKFEPHFRALLLQQCTEPDSLRDLLTAAYLKRIKGVVQRKNFHFFDTSFSLLMLEIIVIVPIIFNYRCCSHTLFGCA